MKILTISNMYPSKKDPVYGTFIKNFYESWLRYDKKINIDLIVIKGRSYNKLKKIICYTFFYLKCMYKLLFNNYDIIYVHTITFTIIPVKFASFFKRLPLVFNVHGGDVLTKSHLSSHLKKIAGTLMPKIKMFVCPSEYFKKVCLAEFPLLDESKIFVSPSGGINNSFFNNRTKLSNNPITLGYVSRIDSDKGWDTFVKAIYYLRKKHIRINALIIGRGKEENELISMIKELGLETEIKYLGSKDHKDLPKYYSLFDCFIFPTKAFESLGLVGLEAMAASVPVIASNIGGPSYYVIEGKNGFKFSTGSHVELAEKIIKYIELSENKKREMQISAFATACRYESNKVSNELYFKLEALCNS